MTPLAQPPTIEGMSETNFNDVAEQEFKKLEYRVNELIKTVDNLKEENRALRAQQQEMTVEHNRLAKNNDEARERVEKIIGRLKALEVA